VLMVVGQACVHREGRRHRHLALQNVPVVHAAETGQPAMLVLSAREWRTNLISTHRMIHCVQTSPSSDQSKDREVTTSHHIQTPAPAAILTMHTYENLHESFHHHRESGMTVMTDIRQKTTAHLPTSAEKAAPGHDQQALNFEISSLTDQLQLQPLHRHPVRHLATDTT